jgi:hypothetical protein
MEVFFGEFEIAGWAGNEAGETCPKATILMTEPYYYKALMCLMWRFLETFLENANI